MISVRVVPAQRDTEMLKGKIIYIRTDAPRHCLTQIDFFSESNTKAPSEEYEKLHRRWKYVALDCLDIAYLKRREIEYSSLIF